MGRKIKPLGLHRKAISISLPLDVIGWLDRLVASKEGGTRSRTIEAFLRASMSKGQTTLNGFLYGCKGCDTEYIAKKELRSNYCKKCETFDTLYVKRNLDMKPIKEEE